MARTLRHPETGKIVRIEFSAQEMADEKVLNVSVEDLITWSKCIKPLRGSGEQAVYAVSSPEELVLLKKRAALLRTQMTETAVKNVEKAGLLDAYAALAEDCPEGLTAHVWRSYGLVVLMQSRYGKMMDAEELAQRANINKRNEKGKIIPDTGMAAKHLRLLEALGYLKNNQAEGRWEHRGLPKSFRGV